MSKWSFFFVFSSLRIIYVQSNTFVLQQAELFFRFPIKKCRNTFSKGARQKMVLTYTDSKLYRHILVFFHSSSSLQFISFYIGKSIHILLAGNYI